MESKPLGELLLAEGLISREQLDEALKMQQMFPDRTVGQVLCRLGYLQESDLSLMLDQKGKRRDLGDILLKEGLITQQHLRHAHLQSTQHGYPLGQVLLRLGHIDEEALAKAVAQQFDLPYLELTEISPDPSLARYISPVYAQKQVMAPISKIGNTLTLAMVHPLTFHDIRQLEDSLRLKIISVIASETSIAHIIRTLYQIDIQADRPAALENAPELIPDTIMELLDRSGPDDEPDMEEEVRKVTEKDSVIVKLVNKIIYDAYSKKSSDIHIEPYPGKKDVTVRIRIDGQCSVYQKIPYKYKYAIPSRIKIMADLDIAERRKPQDGKIDFKKYGPLDIELRVATMPTVGGLEDVVIRILAGGEPLPHAQLGLTDRNRRIFEQSVLSPYGLVLVVGPTGSGKTTTLHSGLAMINTPNRKIWTAEDPVEITQPGLRQVQINPRIGFTFAKALRSFLRLDPDVIMVGEMRDEETAGTAIEASLTGHLVFATLHTNSAAETVSRLLEMGLDPYGFSDSLLCVLAQRLVRCLCPQCKEMYRPTDAELSDLLAEYGAASFEAAGIAPGAVMLARSFGCDRCDHGGYHGRLGIHEMLAATDTLKTLVKRRATTDEIRSQAIADGMTTLRQDGILKVLQGLTDIHEVRRVCIK